MIKQEWSGGGTGLHTEPSESGGREVFFFGPFGTEQIFLSNQKSSRGKRLSGQKEGRRSFILELDNTRVQRHRPFSLLCLNSICVWLGGFFLYVLCNLSSFFLCSGPVRFEPLWAQEEDQELKRPESGPGPGPGTGTRTAQHSPGNRKQEIGFLFLEIRNIETSDCAQLSTAQK